MIFNQEKTISKKADKNVQNVNINYALWYEHYVNRVKEPKYLC
jgi:hypothetical protein